MLHSANIAIICAEFYQELAEELIAGASAVLDAANCKFDVIKVPGALEIPQAINFACATNKYMAFVALGAVIRGETSHYDIVATESSRALMQLALSYNVAIGNGIITAENMQQARIRACVNGKNKGAAAARSTLQLLTIKQELQQ